MCIWLEHGSTFLFFKESYSSFFFCKLFSEPKKPIVEEKPVSRPDCAYTVKKRLAVSPPQPGCHLPNSPWPGIIKYYSRHVGDIPAGYGKTANFFTV
jgi:hypothetical protein